MRSKRVELKMSARLLQHVDEAARANLTSRSDLIRESIIMRLNDQHLVPNPKLEDILELLRQAGKHEPLVY